MESRKKIKSVWICQSSTSDKEVHREKAKVVDNKRIDEGHELRKMFDAPVPGKTRRGRLKTRWKTLVKEIWKV